MKKAPYKCEAEKCGVELDEATHHLILCGTIFRFCCSEHRQQWRRSHSQLSTETGLRRVALAKANNDGA